MSISTKNALYQEIDSVCREEQEEANVSICIKQSLTLCERQMASQRCNGGYQDRSSTDDLPTELVQTVTAHCYQQDGNDIVDQAIKNHCDVQDDVYDCSAPLYELCEYYS